MKFSYDVRFQESIIKFILNHPDGRKAIPLVKGEYFTNIDHHLIFDSIQRFWNTHNRIISLDFMVEHIRSAFETREFEGAFTFDEQKTLINGLEKYFDGQVVRHGDLLLQEIANFASFIEMQEVISSTDLSDYGNYETFSTRVRKAIKIAQAYEEDKDGQFLIKDLKKRQVARQVQDSVFATPFYQVNRWTNAGGYSNGSMIVLIDKAKNLKTFNLVQVTRGYLRIKKKVLFIDLENGMMEIFNRLEQSIGKVDKKALLAGKEDKTIGKVMRRYKRLGGEAYIRRMPNQSTARDIQLVIDELYQEYGFKPNQLVVDYVGIMGSESRHQDDFKRISDAVLELSNLAFDNGIEHVWTAMHVVRDAWKRSGSKYRDSDIAKSIDIFRHAQAVFGIQRDEEEMAANLLRWEVISQRDGKPEATAWFNINPEIQFSRELTTGEVEDVERIKKEQRKKELQEKGRGDA